jgi:phage repressor protein C with HTH and peptisase S24 domain
MFTIEGSSMEPVLNNGDQVLVNKGAHLAGFQDGIWLIRTGDAIMVKKVQVIGPSQLQAVSVNPAYPSFMLDGDFELIGRVVHRSGRL